MQFFRETPPPTPPCEGGESAWRARPFWRRWNDAIAIVGLVLFAPLRDSWADQEQPLWDPAGIEEFSLTEAHGQTVTKADLLGKPWVACFIFTRCLGPCPVVSEQMQTIQNRLKGFDVRLVSFSVDPERDTPEVLLEVCQAL